jgi:predicted TIM-barrel fold metal-dependent hydrolase
MTVIDCDAHVEEGTETWTYLPEEWYQFRPFPVLFPEDTYFGNHNAAWVIDYKLRLFAANPTIMKRSSQKGTSVEIQEFRDVDGRIAAMDTMRIDKQVVFPSLWLGTLAENVELEAALARSYNDFMAAQCAKSNDRIFYVAVLPWRRPEMAVDEIKRVKARGGAAGIYARGMEWDNPLTHPDFRPIYAEAEAQDLPINVHVGNGTSPTISRMLEGIPRPLRGGSTSGLPNVTPYGTGIVSGPYVQYAFQQVMGSDLLERFPKLRFSFMEAGSEWTVPLVRQMRARKAAFVDEVLGQRVFVACAMDEDIEHIINKVGDDFLVTQTDFPHGDAFREDHLLEGLSSRGDVSEASIKKILETNPARLYHI